MFKTVLAATLVALLAAPALAQGVKVTLGDGSTVTGSLEGFERGRYRIKLANGTVREIEESAVQEIVLTEPAAGEKPAVNAGAASDAARAAFDRGDVDEALRQAALAIGDLEQQRSGLAGLVGRISQAQLERLLDKRDAPGLSDALRRTLPLLTPELRRETMSHLVDRFADLYKLSPNEAFTTAFAEALARLAGAGTIEEKLRASLADRFAQMGQAALDRKNHLSAATLLDGALKVDPSRADALRPRLLEALTARARQLLESGDLRGALSVAREGIAADPKNAEARTLVQDLEFAQLQAEVEASESAEALALLRAFLPKARPEHKAWAEQTIARLQAGPPDRLPGVTAQLKKYFPVRVGRTLVYARADGEIRERIRTDSVRREDGVSRVTYTIEDLYRDYTTRKSYFLELEKDAVVLPAGSEREPLLKFPARAGDSWTWQSRGREFLRKVASVSESVTLGQSPNEKTYADCLVVEFISTIERDGAAVQIKSRSTYAPEVGLIRLEYLDPEHHKYSLELVEAGD